MATAQDLSEELRCPICRDILKNPKVIACSHTFCEECLEQLCRTQSSGDSVQCAVCRETSDVVDGDVSKLPSNLIAKGLAEDFKTRSRKVLHDCEEICTVCVRDYPEPAEVYCQHCSEFLCEQCEQQHAKYKNNASHSVVSAADIQSGEVARKRTCREHPGQLELFVCVVCTEYICSTCFELRHGAEGHEVLGIEDYEESFEASVELLQEKARGHIDNMRAYDRFIEGKINHVKYVIGRQKQEIQNTCDDLVRQLERRKSVLLNECSTFEASLCRDLKDIGALNAAMIKNVLDETSTIADRLSSANEGQSLRERTDTCSSLEEMLEDIRCERSLPNSVARRADYLTFYRSNTPKSLELGTIHVNEWEMSAEMDLNCETGMAFMTAGRDGEVAIACRIGNVQVITPDCQIRHEIKNMKVRGLGFMSDGQLVIGDSENKVTLSTPELKELNVAFATLPKDEGHVSGVCVDSNDNIYVCYRKAKRIQMFTPLGGEPECEILCDGFDPWQVAAMRDKGSLLVLSQSNVIRIVDETGSTRKMIVEDVATHVYPAVCRDGSILIASIRPGERLLRIERYSSDLVQMETLVLNHPIDLPTRKWHYLQEFSGGEVALCGPNKLLVFRKKDT